MVREAQKLSRPRHVSAKTEANSVEAVKKMMDVDNAAKRMTRTPVEAAVTGRKHFQITVSENISDFSGHTDFYVY